MATEALVGKPDFNCIIYRKRARRKAKGWRLGHFIIVKDPFARYDRSRQTYLIWHYGSGRVLLDGLPDEFFVREAMTDLTASEILNCDWSEWRIDVAMALDPIQLKFERLLQFAQGVASDHGMSAV